MAMRYHFDLGGLTRLGLMAEDLRNLPRDPALNPGAQAIMAYQRRIALHARPKGSTGGAFFDASWPKWAPAYTRKDGTEVPVWGGVPKASGKGTVKGKLKSSAVGTGAGSRYKAGDRLLGDRGGGLWSRWITARPIVILGGRVAAIIEEAKYAGRNFERRPWITKDLLTYTDGQFVAAVHVWIDRVKSLRRV